MYTHWTQAELSYSCKEDAQCASRHQNKRGLDRCSLLNSLDGQTTVKKFLMRTLHRGWRKIRNAGALISGQSLVLFLLKFQLLR